MKTAYKTALLAVLGLGSVTAAQATTPMNGDLVIGFTSTTVGTQNYVIDLGQFSSMGVNTQLGSLIDAPTLEGIFGSNLSGVSVGIVGTSGNLPTEFDYATATRNSGPYSPDYTVANSTPPTAQTGSAPVTSGHSDVLSLNVGGAFTRGTSVNQQPGDWNSFIAQDYQNGGYSSAHTDWASELGNPMGVLVSDGNGGYSLNLDLYRTGYQSQSRAYAYQGYFNLDINGSSSTLTYNPAVTAVPEPATYGMIAGAGLLLLGLRRQLTGAKIA